MRGLLAEATGLCDQVTEQWREREKLEVDSSSTTRSARADLSASRLLRKTPLWVSASFFPNLGIIFPYISVLHNNA